MAAMTLGRCSRTVSYDGQALTASVLSDFIITPRRVIALTRIGIRRYLCLCASLMTSLLPGSVSKAAMPHSGDASPVIKRQLDYCRP